MILIYQLEMERSGSAGRALIWGLKVASLRSRINVDFSPALVPCVWSLVGPVPYDEVLSVALIQLKSSVPSCCQLHRLVSKLHLAG